MPDRRSVDSAQDGSGTAGRFDEIMDETPGPAWHGATRLALARASAISSLNEGLIYDLLCFRFVFLADAENYWP